MAIHNELVQLSAIVERLLRTHEMYRDSDKRLCARIWSDQLGGNSALHNLSAFAFLVEYTKENSALYSHESIARARRKLQEEHPALRGKKYNARQQETHNVQLSLGYH